MTSTQGRTNQRRSRSATLLRWAWRIVVLAIVALLLWRVVIPQLGGAWEDLHSVSGLSLPLLVAATALELASITCYGLLTHSVLPPDIRPSRWRAIRVNAAGLATSNALPGGGPISTALRLALLGAPRSSYAAVTGSLAIELPISGALLALIFALGTVLCLPNFPGGDWQIIVGIVVLGIALLATLAAISAGSRHMATRILHRITSWLPQRVREPTLLFSERAVAAMSAFEHDRGRLFTALGWAAATWALDACSLWLFVSLAGYTLTPAQLMLGYGLASVLALLQITPGGLGIVEGVLVPLVVVFGADHATALLGVTGWRLAEYWMPIPLGLISGLSLMGGRHRGELRGTKQAVVAEATSPIQTVGPVNPGETTSQTSNE